jgi:hypothetical protein
MLLLLRVVDLDNVMTFWVRIKRTILWAAPWLVILFAAAFHRFILFEPQGYWAGYTQVDWESNVNLANTLELALTGIYGNTVLAWPLLSEFIITNNHFTLTAVLLAVAVALITAMMAYNAPRETGSDRIMIASVIFIGLTIIVASNLILVFVERDPNYLLMDVSSRRQVSSQMGIIAVWVGLIALIGAFLPRWMRAVWLGGIMGAMVLLGGSARILWHQEFVDTWEGKRQFFFALAEQIPNIEDDVVIIRNTDYDTFFRGTDIAHLMFTYIPADLFYDNQTVYMIDEYRVIPTKMAPSLPILVMDNGDFALRWVPDDFTRAIITHQDENGCVHIIDPSQPIPAHLNVTRLLRSLVLEAPADPEQFIRQAPPEDTTLRERYLPPPTQPVNCNTPPEETTSPENALMALTGYEAETPIIIEDATGRANVHLPGIILKDARADDIIHVVDEANHAEYAPHMDISDWLRPEDEAEIIERVGDADTVWTIRRRRDETIVPTLHETLLERGYVFNTIGTSTELYDTEFTLTRYERLGEVEELAQFDTIIDLLRVSVSDATPTACDAVTVTSFWRGSGPTDIPYSVTIGLQRSGGEVITRADGQLTLIPSNTWEPDQIYLDERDLSLPCDLPAGTYDVVMGVYDWRNGERFTATVDGEPAFDDLPITGQLTLQAAEPETN